MDTLRRCLPIRFILFINLFFLAMTAPEIGWPEEENLRMDLTDLSIEELMNVNIIMADRKPRRLSRASTAVFVVTQEDIRRSGATSIPEALRMVPGLHVARISSGKWAVSARGFNSRYAYKLLVLIDGRTVYSPVFSGVFWEALDLILEDIDRIEIIRGPGASLWGANAVNGIINIITKQSNQTQGNLVSAGMGNEEKGIIGLRNGGKWGEDAWYRIYVKYFNRDAAVEVDGDDAGDGWDMFRTGFRSDARLSGKDEITLQGDIYSGEKDLIHVFPSRTLPFTTAFSSTADMFGANILGRWQRSTDTSHMALQTFYSHAENPDLNTIWDEDIWDVDFQHRFALSRRHELNWGLGFRVYRDDLPSTDYMKIEPDSTEEHLYSGFIQDDIDLIKDQLRLTLGTRIEYSDATDFEIQPNARLLWAINPDHVLWASAARAVKTPSRAERGTRSVYAVFPPFSKNNPTALPLEIVGRGREDAESQEVIALEMGYRLMFMNRYSIDMAVYYNMYDNLLEVVDETAYLDLDPARPAVVLPQAVETRMEAETWGFEVAVNWEPVDGWRLKTGYTFFEEDFHPEIGLSLYREDIVPHHQISVRSSMDLPWNLELDLWLRYADEISTVSVPAYTTLDIRLGWNPTENLEISITGRNLFDPEHFEYYEGVQYTWPAEVERDVFAGIVWRF